MSIHTWLHQSPESVRSLLILVSCPQVPTNEQLVIIIFIKSVIPSVSGQEMSLINCSKWLVLNNGQLEFIFTLFQVVSPKQWTT